MALTVVKRNNNPPVKNPININVLPATAGSTTVRKNSIWKNPNITIKSTPGSQSFVPLHQATATSSGNIVPMKRNSYFSPSFESTPKIPKLTGKQFSLQRIASTGTPITTFDGKVLIQSSTGLKHQIVRSANPIKIKPGTAVKLEPNQLPFINGAIGSGGGGVSVTGGIVTGGGGGGGGTTNTQTVRRPTIFIKGPTVPKKTIRTVTIELIEKNPFLHLGVTEDRLGILQNIICPTINVPRLDLYIALKKLRLNEEFAVLGEYFEYSEIDVQRIFARTVIKLAKCMKYLVRWPDSKKYYDRHKNLPIAFRSKLSFVQSLIECVETDVRTPLYPQTLEQLHCKNFKFILTITPSGIISYVSDAYVGNNHDDLTIFNACNFRNVIPKYLSLVADPGKAIRKKTINTNDGGNGNGNDDIIIKQEKLISPSTGGMRIIKRIASSNSTNNNKNLYDTIAKLTNCEDSDSTTDSADEIDDDGNMKMNSIIKKHGTLQSPPIHNSTMNIINSELTSVKVRDFSIPTVRVREPACRLQIRNLIYLLREFKILQSYSLLEPHIYQYINEILVICSALVNLQR